MDPCLVINFCTTDSNLGSLTFNWTIARSLASLHKQTYFIRYFDRRIKILPVLWLTQSEYYSADRYFPCTTAENCITAKVTNVLRTVSTLQLSGPFNSMPR